MSNQNNFGQEGENIAANFLRNKGYEILETNWQHGHKEIDIIAMQKKTLVIVEVKSRSANFIVSPADAVNRKKQKLLVEAADFYVNKLILNVEVRFDIVSVVANGKTYKIEHIEDAFYPLLK